MNSTWLVTPYFLNEFEPDLTNAAPNDATANDAVINGPHDLKDRSPLTLAKVHLPIVTFVQQAIESDNLPISVAGDCVASLPVMAGLQKSGLKPIVVWLDAHGDFNTPETSPSQFLGGMPLAMMVGRGEQEIANNINLNSVQEEDVWLVGARDFDPLEKAALDGSTVNRCAVSDLAKLELDRPVHLHIDNDVMDSNEVPANNFPANGGPSLIETSAACTEFISQNNVVAISFSGWNGQLDTNGKTRDTCAKLLKTCAKAAQ